MAAGFSSFTALYSFKPEHGDEIELRMGDVVLVKKPFDITGWVEGENQRTKQRGQVPGTFLKEVLGKFVYNLFSTFSLIFPYLCQCRRHA